MEQPPLQREPNEKDDLLVCLNRRISGMEAEQLFASYGPSGIHLTHGDEKAVLQMPSADAATAAFESLRSHGYEVYRSRSQDTLEIQYLQADLSDEEMLAKVKPFGQPIAICRPGNSPTALIRMASTSDAVAVRYALGVEDGIASVRFMAYREARPPRFRLVEPNPPVSSSADSPAPPADTASIRNS